MSDEQPKMGVVAGLTVRVAETIADFEKAMVGLEKAVANVDDDSYWAIVDEVLQNLYVSFDDYGRLFITFEANPDPRHISLDDVVTATLTCLDNSGHNVHPEDAAANQTAKREIVSILRSAADRVERTIP